MNISTEIQSWIDEILIEDSEKNTDLDIYIEEVLAEEVPQTPVSLWTKIKGWFK